MDDPSAVPRIGGMLNDRRPAPASSTSVALAKPPAASGAQPHPQFVEVAAGGPLTGRCARGSAIYARPRGPRGGAACCLVAANGRPGFISVVAILAYALPSRTGPLSIFLDARIKNAHREAVMRFAALVLSSPRAPR